MPSNRAMQGTACQRPSASLRAADAAPDRERYTAFEVTRLSMSDFDPLQTFVLS